MKIVTKPQSILGISIFCECLVKTNNKKDVIPINKAKKNEPEIPKGVKLKINGRKIIKKELITQP